MLTVLYMRVDLAFGKTGITVDLPEGIRYRVLEARSAKPLADASAALEEALVLSGHRVPSGAGVAAASAALRPQLANA